jgi:hypothetical protein
MPTHSIIPNKNNQLTLMLIVGLLPSLCIAMETDDIGIRINSPTRQEWICYKKIRDNKICFSDMPLMKRLEAALGCQVPPINRGEIELAELTPEQRQFIAGITLSFDWDKYSKQNKTLQKQVDTNLDIYNKSSWWNLGYNLIKLHKSKDELECFQKESMLQADMECKRFYRKHADGITDHPDRPRGRYYDRDEHKAIMEANATKASAIFVANGCDFLKWLEKQQSSTTCMGDKSFLLRRYDNLVNAVDSDEKFERDVMQLRVRTAAKDYGY